MDSKTMVYMESQCFSQYACRGYTQTILDELSPAAFLLGPRSCYYKYV